MNAIGTVGIIIGILVLLTIIIGVNVRIVSQSMEFVIERLGAYRSSWSVGLHVKLPFLDRIVSRVNLREQVIDFRPQSVITKDNVTMKIDAVLYYQVTDSKLYTYGVLNPMMALENLTATTLRNVIGQLELDETLSSRDIINTQMRSILDEATDPWGIKVNRVEVKNIIPPADIQEAMEKQMRAERERRESILRAEGQKTSAILVAEGNKQSRILEASAEKESAILKAQGESESILMVQEATARGIEMIKKAGADQTVIALKSLDTLVSVANGQATKLIIPSEIQNMTALAASLKEVING
ncbi:MAG: paraslipin [Spirochaetales bacterium]|nr:paraslipin [Spirochaetales bacterium]